ncbi:acetyl-CoA carboxylase biotin carboxylase subunit family protein [Vibrio chagasii]
MNIMILGAGIYQLPLIKKAKKMGHKVYVVSPDGKYPGIEEADVWVNSDTREKNYILQVAKKANIDGVVTTGTDVAVPTIGFLIDNLGLSGTGYNASKISMNKFLMKKCFIENGVNTADFMIVSSKEKMVDAVEVIGLPVMVKAIDSSGSRGITKVDNIGDLGRAYDDAISVSQEKEVIVEKFLQGKEIGAQAIVGNGKLKGVLLHDDLVTPPPVSVPIGHSMPITLEEQLITAIETQIMLAVSSIGIKETIANVDIMISEGKPYLLEIGARMGATCLPENVSIYTGIDIYEHLVLEALGQKPIVCKPEEWYR